MGLFDIFKKNNTAESKPVVYDYSTIDRNEKAKVLFASGELVKLYLMPLDFGGLDNPLNTLFVPKFVNAAKNNFDSKVNDLLDKGLDIRYAAKPEYKGNSFIASKLVINVTGEKEMTEIIDIW